jgi:hypothetical protein
MVAPHCYAMLVAPLVCNITLMISLVFTWYVSTSVKSSLSMGYTKAWVLGSDCRGCAAESQKQGVGKVAGGSQGC